MDVACRPLGVHTTCNIPELLTEQSHNMLEAMEAYILRTVISTLPTDAPILSCHDELSTLPELVRLAERTWESNLKQLAETFATLTAHTTPSTTRP